MFDIVDLPDAETLSKLVECYPQLDPPVLQAWLDMMRTATDCHNDLDRFLAGHSLSQRKFFVLILLLRNPDGLLISQLAKGTGVSCATMSGVVDGLVKGRLVIREPHARDRRALLVTITSAGRAVLDQILPEHYLRVNRIMSCLDQTEREQLQGLLKKIRCNLRDPA